MKKVHYIGWYITDKEWGQYKGNVPGMMKMRYVADQLKKTTDNLHILSFADKQDCLLYGMKDIVNDGMTIHYTGGCKNSGKIGRYINTLIKKIYFVLYILFCVSNKDLIVLYHSYAYTKLLAKLKKNLKRNIVIEVEEIYGYNAIKDMPWVGDEIAQIKKFQKFTCVNDGIPQVLGLRKQDFVVIYGAGVFPERTSQRINDGKIHVVYSGTIEGKKMGAMSAVESARFFSSKYQLHISGFGKPENVSILKNRIAEINKEVGEERIKYEGFLSEEDMHKLMFSCHIGLSPNVLRPNFANSTFPSKVVTYMCHDLSVVISYATAYDFPISEGWVFYREQTPECIAEAVMSAEVKPIGYYRPRIEKMNEEVIRFFKQLQE